MVDYRAYDKTHLSGKDYVSETPEFLFALNFTIKYNIQSLKQRSSALSLTLSEMTWTTLLSSIFVSFC